MLNNKGQSLVLFIIILPILIFILILVIDVGKIIVLKQELNNISEFVLDYGLDSEKIYLCGVSSKDAGNRISTIIEDSDRDKYGEMIKKLLMNQQLVLK